MERSEVIEILIDKHQSELLRYAGYLLKDASMAQDAVQLCFVTLYNCPGLLAGNVRALLFKMVRNRCLNILRRRRMFARIRSLFTHETEAPERADSSLLVSDDHSELGRAVNALPEKWREAVLLRYRDDLSYEEIGKIMNMSANHVGNTLHRALEHLRKELEGLYE